MITTEFGRLVATGAGLFVFVFLMSYLRLRREATAVHKKTRPPVNAVVAGRAR